jgi:hypothetical protein
MTALHLAQLAINFVLQHELTFGLVVTAGIITMPAPDAPWGWRTLYRWLYDWLHQFLNLRRPTPPANTPPAKPQLPNPSTGVNLP